MTRKGRKGSQQHFGIVLCIDGMMGPRKGLGRESKMYSIIGSSLNEIKALKPILTIPTLGE
jgi:hypothetical protein